MNYEYSFVSLHNRRTGIDHLVEHETRDTSAERGTRGREKYFSLPLASRFVLPVCRGGGGGGKGRERERRVTESNFHDVSCKTVVIFY